MMVAHWESSKRPLYVKTIWKDGQHHVVLREETSQPPKKWEKSPNSARIVKSATGSYSSNLNVSSMKLLKPSLSDGSDTLRRCKTSVKCHHKSSSKRLNKQVSFSVPLEDKTNTFGLSIKSNSIDIGDSGTPCYTASRQCPTAGPEDNIANYITYNTFLESSSDSLSERVMVWLDLATQTSNNFDQKTQPLRVVTAESAAKKKQNNFSRHRCLSSCQPIAFEEKPKRVFQVEGVSQSLQFTNSSVLNKNNRVFDEDETLISEDKPVSKMLVSSTVEENYVSKPIENGDCFRKKFGVKRQLHIFMPDLPKKFSDCDSSVLSSKLSNCSIQKNSNQRII
ncbi:uncharacterized protein [Leptinotarsa decemlineata]|uniref:uncharacterized protein n=1 Tax=Leptinotarsa decemlineata TaxID=7539 RepID=UPI003D30B8E5